jgi:Uma2 family endonuclease
MIEPPNKDGTLRAGEAPATSESGRWPLYDVQDYENLPDDGKRYEIVGGDIHMTPAPSLRHQAVSRNLEFLLHTWAKARHGVVFYAPTDVELGPHDIVQPDLVFISKDRRSILTPKRIVGSPDLVVEILSESTAERDWTVKLKTYARFDVQEYWVVDPDLETVTIHARDAALNLVPIRTFNKDEALTSKLLRGFQASLADVFTADFDTCS